MAEDGEYIYDVQFELIGTDGIVFEDEVKIGDFKLKSERSGIRFKIIGTTTIKLDKDDYKLARELAMKKIQQELLPLLVLTSNEGYIINKLTVNLRPIIKRNGKNVSITVVNTIDVKAEVHAFKIITKDTVESYIKELESYKDKIEKLSKEDRENFLRAIRYWNRGKVDDDKIDRFIDFYIAFEILGKNLAKNENQWVKEICEDYSLRREYDGAKINEIRDALVHAKHKKLSKETAEALAIKYADEFGKDVFKLIIDFLNEKAQ